MPIYKTRSTGNTIVADIDFVSVNFPDDYDEVIVPVNRRAEIVQALAEIDAKSSSPRALRESALGNTTYLTALDLQADALRTELKGL